jgi:N-acetylneuraminic acid mutarotase
MKTRLVLSVMLLTLIVSGIQAQDYWTRLPDFTHGARAGAVAVAIDDKAYIGLGVGSIWYYDFWQFNPKDNSWTQLADFPDGYLVAQEKVRGRQGAVALAIDGKAYVGTGLYDRTVYSDFYSFDPKTNTWDSLAAYPGGPRYIAMGFSIGNKGYLGAGKDQGTTYGTYDFYEFDPYIGEFGTWTKKADIGDATDGYVRRSTGVGFSLGKKGYIGLGVKDYDYRMSDLWEYDPANDLWTKKEDFPTSPELGYGRWGAIAFTISDKAYVGCGYYYEPHGDIWQYDPSTDKWNEKAQNTPEGRGQGIAFSIGNQGYVGFGYNNSPDYLIDIWKYCLGMDIQFPINQNLCYDNSNTYTIPLTTVICANNPIAITYTIEGATQRIGTGINASGIFNPGISTINWLAIDAKGQSMSGTTLVNIDFPISISIPDKYAVSPGGEVNTIYIGYGPTSQTYQALVTGGTPFDDGSYQYLWSTGETTSAITVAPTIPGLYNYAVTVTDKLGCTATQSITVNIIDVRCGKNLDKVELCKTPPGNPDRRTVVCISKEDVANQLINGSNLSVCSPVATDFLSGDDNITIFPNPNKGSFNVIITDIASTWCEVRIMDRNGLTLDTKTVNNSETTKSVQFELSGGLTGVYFVKLMSAEGVKVYKVMLE